MLDVSQKYLIALSKAAVFDELPPDPPEGTDWEYIYKKSSEQNISGLIASAVLRLPEDKQPENADMWNEVMLQTMYVMSRKFAEFERMYAVLEKNGIVPICLKGIAVKELYPVPELRTMGDFDVLVEKEQRKKAEMLFEKEGYTLRRDTLFTEVNKNGVHGEIFISIEEEIRTDTEYWQKQLKENTIILKSGMKALMPSYELAYSVIHMAKHLKNEGCGIRNIFDLVLILKNRAGIDFKLAEKICDSQNDKNIFCYALNVAENYYDIDVQYEYDQLNSELFCEYLLRYGVFGKPKDGNILIRDVARNEGQCVSTFRRIFFPPKEMLKNKYRYVRKSSLLIPVAWVHRFINGIFIRRYSVNKMVTGLHDAVKYDEERKEWLKKLGLI